MQCVVVANLDDPLPCDLTASKLLGGGGGGGGGGAITMPQDT